MSSTSWKEYIEDNIARFRKYYDLLTNEEKRWIEESKKARLFSLSRPCQVIVIDPLENSAKCLLVFHAQIFSDRNIAVYEGKSTKDLRKEFGKKEARWLSFIQEKDVNKILDYLERRHSAKSAWSVVPYESSFSILTSFDFRSDALFLFDLAKTMVSKESHIAQRRGTVEKKASIHPNKNVFIVHGRDHKPMEELKTMLKEFGLNPVVLHEQPSGGSLTLAEKLEKYSEDVGCAIVILTPEDIGVCLSQMFDRAMLAVDEERDEAMKAVKRILDQSKGSVQHFVEFNQRFVHDPSDVMEFISVFKARARQNVIFEMGYFWGLLKRKRVFCFLKGDVEKPSDIEGIVYIPFEESIKEAHGKLATELNAAGFRVELPSQLEKFESRYWVNLGVWEDWEPVGKEGEKLYRELKEAMSSLSNGVTEDLALVYKTNELENAKETVRHARRIVDEYKGTLLESELDLDMIKEGFGITMQPQCPRCGKLGRFSDTHCSDCGTELHPKEDIEV
jgi:predicted nucleotide-binding protein